MLLLSRLGVENFRCFRKKEPLVEFHPELTVLVAKNGNGKSAILDAIRISLGTFTKAFETLSQSNISKSDASISPERIELGKGACYPVRIAVEGVVDGVRECWERALQDIDGHTTSKLAKAISSYGEKLKLGVSSDNGNVELPIIAHYGTGRLWGDDRSYWFDPEHDFASEDRFAGYEDALTPNSIYAQVKRWMSYAFQVKSNPVECETRIGKLISDQYSAVESAVNRILRGTGFRAPHYNFTYRDMSVLCERPEGCIPVQISHTSDGVKAAIALVADIAYRCVRLNPSYGADACARTQGVVMVDEIDLFLHPSWQQRFVSDLREIFPRIQFIVSTHSPQVVSSVPRECIRVIAEDCVYSPEGPTQGVEINDLLLNVFGTDPVPEQLEIVKKLNQLLVLAAEGEPNGDRWNPVYKALLEHYGANYGPLVGAVRQRDFILRMREARNAQA